MTLARVACRAQVGLTAPAVDVEVHLGAGLPSFNIVGLPATEVKESRERVRAALANAGFEQPAGRITVNLAPADLPKDGGRFDLAIAIGILLASGQLRPRVALEGCELYGELALSGELRAVHGALLAARAAPTVGRTPVRAAGQRRARCASCPGSRPSPPVTCSPSAGTSPAKRRWRDAARWAMSRRRDVPHAGSYRSAGADRATSLADVIGQAQAKRALLVAAAGGHSLLLVGLPGCGKSMLAQRLPALLPPLEPHEALDVATVASVAGVRAAIAAGGARCRGPSARRTTRPPPAPSSVAGPARARARSPSRISACCSSTSCPSSITVCSRRCASRSKRARSPYPAPSLQAEYPARFQLVAAMNPCPCGHLGDPRRACRCTPAQLAHYRGRLSGPLLDRIDLRVTLRAGRRGEISQAHCGALHDAGAAAPARAARPARGPGAPDRAPAVA